MTIARRQEFEGFALERAIRSRIKDRAWYRTNRLEHPWADLERENRELRRANEILKSASAFFAAELDGPRR